MAERSNPLVVVRPNWRHTGRPVVLTDTEFGIAGQGGRLHPRSAVGSVVSAFFAPGMHQHVFVLDRRGGLLLRLRGDVYSPEKMNAFVDALGVPVTDFPDVVTRPQAGHVSVVRGLQTDYPGFVTPTEFDQTHPGLLSERDFMPHGESRVFTSFFTIGAVVLVILLVLVVVALIFFGPPTTSRF